MQREQKLCLPSVLYDRRQALVTDVHMRKERCKRKCKKWKSAYVFFDMQQDVQDMPSAENAGGT